MEEYLRSRVPWSTEPSLKQKTDEAGVDFDRFIYG
ncbi:MAG: helix-turn-helix domain-containing protein, partial [Bacillota bacterium]